MVINFVDYSLNQGAPAGHESAETPIGHESNGAVAGEGVKFIVIHFRALVIFITSCGGRLVKRDTPHNKELELSLNIMEATPEDQHSHQVPPTEQLVIRPYLVPLLPTFHGMESENPYAHIKEFEDVCNTFQEGGASIDLMRLKLFPFTLKDKAKIWLNSLRPRTTPRDNVWRRFHEQKSEEAMDFLSYVAEVSRGWDEPTKGEVGKMKSQLVLSMLRLGCIP
ncbi:hypothetical protein CK203_058398 [Vitis vinifera]|uniref:Retrotransposon gag domain-containing protein n=1 Tax=Vitis vinifera TaxID=29760 RepID=A0A438GI75_VITVI|nr:hypothetical protein CK203_058398 [Vitis vinifera]